MNNTIKHASNKKLNMLILTFIMHVFISSCSKSILPTKEKTHQNSNNILHNSVIQSPNDKRDYEIITLANNLEVILVSDATLDRSAVALAVNVGSYHEKDGFWGLAHYLEHMLFLGTEKYPEVGSFSEFISNNGGKNNAYTDMDHTNYMVSIKNQAYEPLLDRFSDYFKAPLLSPEYIDKERHAVHSEWSMKGVYDGVILGHLNGLTLNPDHPVSHFTWGNLSTLTNQNNKSLHQATVEFYNEHYSANRMKVAMVSNQPIANLKELAKTYFGNIPNRNSHPPLISSPAITQQQMKKLIRYSPNKDLKKIQIKFVIENNSAQFLAKPNYYLTYLINSQMEGTLFSTLKEQGLITDLSAWSDASAFKNAGEFVIDIDLTAQGLRDRDSIINAVFDYIALIKNSGIHEKYHQEIKQSLNNAFTFQSKYDEYNYAANLAAKLFEVPNKYVLSADYEYTTFSPAYIQKTLEQLTLDKARIFYIDKGQDTDTQVTFFDARYSIEELTNEQENLWLNNAKRISLNLPQLNTLMPNDFSLINNHAQNKPISFLSEKGSVTHLRQINEFNVPKGALYLNLNTELGTESAKKQALLSLLHLASQESLSNLSAEASIAGMWLGIEIKRGLTLYSSGYSDKQLVLLEKALTSIYNHQMNKIEFDQLKNKLYTNLNNKKANALYTQAFDYYNTFLEQGKYPLDDVLKHTKSISVNEFEYFKLDKTKQFYLWEF